MLRVQGLKFRVQGWELRVQHLEFVLPTVGFPKLTDLLVRAAIVRIIVHFGPLKLHCSNNPPPKKACSDRSSTNGVFVPFGMRRGLPEMEPYKDYCLELPCHLC